MQDFTALLGIAIALSIGAISPGPSFVVVARIAITGSRMDGIFAALGMGVGGIVFAVISLLGLHGLLLAMPSAYWVLKTIGGLYLVFLGARIWIGANEQLIADVLVRQTVASSRLKSFIFGLVTQLSNPKTAIVYASVFMAFLPASISSMLGMSVVCLVFFIEVGWYSFVAITLSSTKPRAFYLRNKVWFDRVAGGVLTSLGVKLIISSGRL